MTLEFLHSIFINHFVQSIKYIDEQVFLFINKTIANTAFDALMPTLRNAVVWTPLYILLFLVAIKQYKKTIWLWFVFALVTVLITDQLSAHIIKPYVHRLRPYCDPSFSQHVRLLLNNINRGYSFVSSHATNHFGIAVFFICTLHNARKQKFWLLLWASLICIAQVYVGVHYPFDVLCGAVLGISIGYITSKYFVYLQDKFKTT